MSATQESSAQGAQLAPLDKVKQFVKDHVITLLDLTKIGDLELDETLNENQEQLEKFISDPFTTALVVDRVVVKDSNEESSDEGESVKVTFVVKCEVGFETENVCSVVFVKNNTTIDSDKSLQSQIISVPLAGGKTYESVHLFISKILGPLYKSYIKQSGRGERDGNKLASVVEKSLTDAEVALLHLQQNIDIPEVKLVIHPQIQAVLAKAAAEGRKAKVDDLGELVQDSKFLNQLQGGCTKWVAEIRKVTNLEKDASTGSSLQEVAFWINLERALQMIKLKRDSDEVALTLEVLKSGKRFHATVGFDANTKLEEKRALVTDYNLLMKDFPLNELISAGDLEKIKDAIGNIFTHFKKLRMTKYPLTRAMRLAEAISRDLNVQLLKILSANRLMHIDMALFDETLGMCQAIFSKWDDEHDRFIALLREINKKKRDNPVKLTWKMKTAHKKLEQRLSEIKQFRRQHEQFRAVIRRVLKATSKSPQTEHSGLDAGEMDPVEQVDHAYEYMKMVDCLEVENTVPWEMALKNYGASIDSVEATITARLKDQLVSSTNSNEMFAIFRKYNALFIRERIRGAIRDYQTKLIHKVSEDIECLQTRFTSGYAKKEYKHLVKLNAMPTVSAKILWVKHIEIQLQSYMQRVEDVLGKGWENHVEGRHLKMAGDNFMAKLNTQPLFEEWVRKVQHELTPIPEKIFEVKKLSVNGKVTYSLQLTFDKEKEKLFEEVTHLKPLGYRVPLKIMNASHQAKQCHPYAVSIENALHEYKSTNKLMKEVDGVESLLSAHKKEIQMHIQEGLSLSWESYKMDSYTNKFVTLALDYESKMELVAETVKSINNDLDALSTCPYTKPAIRELLDSIQKGVDELVLGNYANIDSWVEQLDKKIEDKLAKRLEQAIHVWTQVLKRSEELDEYREKKIDIPQIQLIMVEIRLMSQVMFVKPDLAQARQSIYDQLIQWEAICTDQERVRSTRFKLSLEEDATLSTYRSIISKSQTGQTLQLEAYTAIDKVMCELDEYTAEWLSYQSLWEIQEEVLFGELGNNLNKWIKTLQEMRKCRTVFDTQDNRKEIFPFIVDYARVQSKVSLKYDFWHNDVLQKFGNVLSQEMSAFHNTVRVWRSELESHSVDSGTTSDAVKLITQVQALKKQMAQGISAVEIFRSSQRLLGQQRFQFPQQWLDAENVGGEWDAFEQILLRRDSAIQLQVANLRTKIESEDGLVKKRVAESLEEWHKSKPEDGNQRPEDALAVLATYEGKLKKLTEEREKMLHAKKALDMSEARGFSSEVDKLTAATEELNDMKEVWQALVPIHTGIENIKDVTWLSVQPRKVRQSLDELNKQLKTLPVMCRSYSSYEQTKNTLNNYGKMNMLVSELKSDAIKERHWRQLMKEMRVSWTLSNLTLGQVWDANIQRYENVIKQVLLVAQGELALEEFLKQVRDHWQSYELELINYQKKTKLVKGWDDLFNKLKEHQNSLAAMKLSPYYREFSEDAQSWEEKLNKINTLFDVWIDVQRRWVYLESLFTGSADIATLLPFESSRFNTTSTEFLALMKKVVASPRILEVVNIQGVQRLLDRLADMLAQIQRALGEYLERERSSFPRFYFVGDEDLLEIMGNSKDITRLQKHLKKMFAGITTVDVNEEEKTITAFHSRENETVQLATPVTFKDVRINEWLSELEIEMKRTLAKLLSSSLAHFTKLDIETATVETYMEWLDKFPAQVLALTSEIWWSDRMESTLSAEKSPEIVESLVSKTLALLADSVLHEQPPIRRKKIEALITELVHKRDTCRRLAANGVRHASDFGWLQCMRFYFDPKQIDPVRSCIVKIANAQFFYGFEYLGIQERLVRTPLTDRCYLTMTQALHSRLGGSPFGPAGTGKTESVKALGNQLGRFVLVFNCDETFDFQAMGRILVGLCQVGAWGCFDEFNRLEERMLSAVSQQIQTIQEAVKAGGDMSVNLVGKKLNVNANIGIFITMNPGYSGRSNLPDNLKQLFRSLAMTQPDRQLIAQVMLFSQGFRSAESLANKIVPLFILCKEQLSAQSHYDFGLRALKYVLVSAGNIKRDRLDKMAKEAVTDEGEQQMLIQSVCETLVPKLVSEDIALLSSLLNDVFPSIHYTPNEMPELREHLRKVCDDDVIIHSDREGELGSAWMDKVLQLYQITNLNHGLMLVGPSGSGKTTAWKTLLKALEKWEKVEGVAHVIDAKAMSKDSLYGVMDQNTREWTDGLFTSIVRKIIDNVRGEADKRQWIIFDGDVDPEWVENLNSVLDDNKLLTLPNGERLGIPPNVRIIFEVADLKYATLATVSRCGMVWFSEEVVTHDMLFQRYLSTLNSVPLGMEALGVSALKVATQSNEESREMHVQKVAARALAPHFSRDGIVSASLKMAMTELEHIMQPTEQRLLSSFFAMMSYTIRQLLNNDSNLIDVHMMDEEIIAYVQKSMLTNLVWAFSGDGKWKIRQEMSDFIRRLTTIDLPPNAQACIIDYEVQMNGTWQPWLAKVPQMEIEANRVAAADLVIPTVDTVRHEMLLAAWLAEHKPLVLCGPPGSGKTMTLLAALRSQPDMDVVNVNFSSSTTPELLMRTFDHYCEYRRTPNGVVLAPVQLSKWLVIFCDEINLPEPDKYGTQRVISFIRQLVELNGFYRTTDHSWVTLERIQFVGACNPPTDPGRHPMTLRFLRHVPIVYVDYPGEQSLIQIYGTFNRAMLKLVPNCFNLADPMTSAMVDVYLASQEHFTQDDQPHYVYSPRELTRWVRGISEAIAPLESLTAEQLVRLWAHEALRLFQDRLVTEEEREWTDELVDSVAEKRFHSACNVKEAVKRPLLYSCWLSRDYVPVTREALKEYVSARLKGFYEEELDVQLVLFDQMLDHVLRIDRIYRQPQGHLLLIGTAGAGKTTLSRFVAWLNGLSVFQLKVHSRYTAADFDEDMRIVLRRAGCKNEKICFIMDESNMLDTGFLERLNTLLANGEVPGLFEGDEHSTLMSQIKESANKMGVGLQNHDDLYKWFTMQVMRNLHVVFTMNPSSGGLRERASTSPALFNRCVLNWFGDWADSSLYQVCSELTMKMEVNRHDYEAPLALPPSCELLPSPPTYRDAVINTMVHVHNTVKTLNEKTAKKGHRVMALTPRHFLDFINQFINVFREKRSDLEEEKLHLNIGLKKIRETQEQVKELQKSLHLKNQELEEKRGAANMKLKEMVADQQKAEEEKRHSEQLQNELSEQLTQMAAKKEAVQADLGQVEPAVQEAKKAVAGIKKSLLVEVRSMANPPVVVRLALEAICILLGENVGTDWKAIRSVLVKEDFMPRILGFDTDKIQPETLKQMEKYMANPDWDFEKVNRASQACGPMVKWTKAQLLYSNMLNKVEPLRNELNRLEKDTQQKTLEGEAVKTRIVHLEKSIAAYKEEYAQLIAQAENIKQNLNQVQEKVTRSTELLSSLESERDRWSRGCDGFDQQMNALIGDALLSGAFLAYSGYFDQMVRNELFHKWFSLVYTAGIDFRHDLARIEYLSTADDRHNWQSNQLPVDDLCTENAIMLHRFNRYPLIIDPSGQAIEFVMKQFGHKNIQKTSFLHEDFRKQLESALRFGNWLLVQDVESYDPILNPVLNREVKRGFGRVLITIGDQDIDLSPSFQIFLITRDPTVEFPPDICSRVTFVNFTVTSSSLSGQCLHQVLKNERPDVDKKRSDLLKLQGEFAVRLRHLEKALLAALNESKGKILDDNSVIGTLEKLKTEAAEVAQKVAETDKIMEEVEQVSAQYQSLANACANIYNTLQQLNEVHFLYRYSLDFLVDIFTGVLKTPELSQQPDYTSRLNLITVGLFQSVFSRVSRGMLHTDKVLLALLLLKIHIRTITQHATHDAHWNLLVGRSKAFGANAGKEVGAAPSGDDLLNEEQIKALVEVQKLPTFDTVFQQIQKKKSDISSWLLLDNPEVAVPVLWIESDEDKLDAIDVAMNELVLIQALRPDRLMASAHRLVSTAFGDNFMQQDKVINLKSIIDTEIVSSVPVLLCSATGYDASGKIEDLAVETGKQLTSIAIGSAEGFRQADQALTNASSSGRWVLLKNVHLAPSWLTSVEKKLHSVKPHPQFRLFLTAEINPKLPSTIVAASHVIVFEPATGLKANLLRSLTSIPGARLSKVPTQRSRLFFLVCWLHALVQERLRYTPLGWSTQYEFSDADLRVSCDTLDAALDGLMAVRSTISVDKLPWTTLRTLLSQCIYGGKIDNQFDQKLLDCVLQSLFTSKSFDTNHVLIEHFDENQPLCMPDVTSKDELIGWVESIKPAQLPSWLGLSNNAEKVLLKKRGEGMMRNVLKVTEVESVGEMTNTEEEAAKPQWMAQLAELASTWLELLPTQLPKMKRTVENIKDPLFRFFEREVKLGTRLLNQIRADLDDLIAVCRVTKRQSNETRALAASLQKGQVPSDWVKYTIPADVTVMDYVIDLNERFKQLVRVGSSANLKKEVVWLGGTFSPEAYITATRQQVAQTNSWSLEQLNLHIHIGSTDRPEVFRISGIDLRGAKSTGNNSLELCEAVHSLCDQVEISWKLEPAAGERLPLYLYGDRRQLVTPLTFVIPSPTVFYQRGVALVTNAFL